MTISCTKTSSSRRPSGQTSNDNTTNDTINDDHSNDSKHKHVNSNKSYHHNHIAVSYFNTEITQHTSLQALSWFNFNADIPIRNILQALLCLISTLK